MYDGTIDRIDWDAIWDGQMKLASFAGHGVEFWNSRATRAPSLSRQDNYVEHMLRRMEISPEDSVLDVGCGTGALSIPLARRTRCVTALDHSTGMLEVLSNTLVTEGIKKVTIINADWPRLKVGTDIDFHDVVLASRCLPMGDLRKSLTNIDQAARKLCYLTWIVASTGLQAKACEILGREYHPMPDYTIIYNMLRGIGICANVEIFETRGRRRFPDLEAAVTDAVRGHEIEDTQAKERLKAFLESELPYDDGHFYHDVTMKWALLWWRK